VKRIKQLVVGIAVVAVLALSSSVALAHNAGHVILPSGECVNVGSQKEAPLVGPDKQQLDLIPGPGDQYGARYAADQGNSKVLPGECH
jgi:hypothetical protein